MEAGFLKSLFEVQKMGVEISALVAALMGKGAAPGHVGLPGFTGLAQETQALKQQALEVSAEHLEQRQAVAAALEDLQDCERRLAGGAPLRPALLAAAGPWAVQCCGAAACCSSPC
jgi:hypothetical protein